MKKDKDFLKLFDSLSDDERIEVIGGLLSDACVDCEFDNIGKCIGLMNKYIDFYPLMIMRWLGLSVMENYKILTQKELNNEFIKACRFGDLQAVKYLLTSSELKNHANIISWNNYGFKLACRNGSLKIVEFLLASPELKEHADIHVENDYGVRGACAGGHLEVIRFLLASPELEDKADIHANNDEGFVWACKNGHLDVVKYLLTSPELKGHADIHVNNDEGFRLACENGHLNVVKFLIFDMDIDKTEVISDFLKKYKYKEIEDLFNVRELKKELESELDDFSCNNRKHKI